MKTNTPVVGKIPRMVPEWMGKVDQNGNLILNENGIWTANLNSLPDLIATMVGLFMEDSLPNNIVEGMDKFKSLYTTDERDTSIEEVYGRIFDRRKVELETLIQQTEKAETQTAVENNK